ncbi:hypothetical protein CKAH01_08136 [Colletotrichum kahawae]|uniref:Uncharacterized protein n=1 Tax=Colletotrichum kahawae TaxID=34407 RepID=A0AAD9Y3A1_COLKA|nr:hypothetical protein CKAH01_08136 [Colletotrichum kahawae]
MRLLPCSSHVFQSGPAILVAFVMARLHLSPTTSRPARSLSTPTFLARPRVYSAVLSVLITSTSQSTVHHPSLCPEDSSPPFLSLSFLEACVRRDESHQPVNGRFHAFVATSIIDVLG